MSNKEDFRTEIRDFWQQRTAGEVTDEDVRQIIENVTGFFSILQEWEIAEREISHSCPKRESSIGVREASTKGS